MAHTASHLFAAAWLTAGAAFAYESTLDRRALEDAIAIGQSRIESTRTRFHAAYRIRVAEPPVDYIEIVTPFRRVVLAAEARARTGGGGFGQRDALEALAAEAHGIDIIVELTFHPLNTYLGVPQYGIALEEFGAGAIPVAPRTVDRIPRFGPRLEGLAAPSPYPGPGLPDGTQPMLGGTVIARFDGALLKPAGAYELVIQEDAEEIARTRFDLGSVR